MKKTKFLKVMSILELIAAVLMIIGLVTTIAMRSTLADAIAATGYSITYTVIASGIGAVLSLAAAIFGLQAKNYRGALIVGVLLIALMLFEAVYSMMKGGAIANSIPSLIVQILYTWSVYQAGE